LIPLFLFFFCFVLQSGNYGGAAFLDFIFGTSIDEKKYYYYNNKIKEKAKEKE
jgi:hypothetical protein